MGTKSLSEPMLEEINWTLKNKLQWNFNWNLCFFIQRNAFEKAVNETAAILSRERLVKDIYPSMLIIVRPCTYISKQYVFYMIISCTLLLKLASKILAINTDNDNIIQAESHKILSLMNINRGSPNQPVGGNGWMYIGPDSGTDSEEIRLTLPLDKMVAILQTIFSDALWWMKSFVFWLKFH